VKTCAAVVAGGRNNKYVVLLAQPKSTFEQAFCFTGRRGLAPTDADDVRALLDGLLDRSRQIQLGEVAFLIIAEDGNDQTAAMWCDTDDGATWLTEDDACNMGPVQRHRAGPDWMLDKSVKFCEISTLETRMGEIDRSVEHCNAHPAVAASVRMEGR